MSQHATRKTVTHGRHGKLRGTGACLRRFARELVAHAAVRDARAILPARLHGDLQHLLRSTPSLSAQPMQVNQAWLFPSPYGQPRRPSTPDCTGGSGPTIVAALLHLVCMLSCHQSGLACQQEPAVGQHAASRTSLGCGLPSRSTWRVILRFLVVPLASSCSVHTSGTSTVRGGRGAPPPNLSASGPRSSRGADAAHAQHFTGRYAFQDEVVRPYQLTHTVRQGGLMDR